MPALSPPASFPALDLSHGLENFLAARRAALALLGVSRPLPIDDVLPDSALLTRIMTPWLKETDHALVAVIPLLGHWVDACGRQPSAIPDRQVVNLVQKRFELDRHLKAHYPADFRKEETNESSAAGYAVFALSLILAFRHTGNFNYLNTALKVNDRLVALLGECSDDEKKLARAAFRLEYECLTPYV